MSTRLLKIQLVVVCFLAFSLLVALSPKLDYLRNSSELSRPLDFDIHVSNVNRGSQLSWLSSIRRFVGTAQAELAETSPPFPVEVNEEDEEGSDRPERPSLNLSSGVGLRNVTPNVDVHESEKLKNLKRLKRKWHIRWEDRDPSKTEALQSLITVGYSWNDTQDEDRRHVIFNRVGKCGSRSIIHLLESLAVKNQFYLISSQTFNKKKISLKHEEEFVSILSRIQSPFIYQRHLHFVDFKKYGKRQPTYINIIRDPLERAVSQYYFLRFGDENKEDRGFKQNSTDPLKFLSYEECIIQQLPQCINKTFYIIPFFCGQDPHCKFPTERAFKQAKENVKKYFLAVGVLEELPDTLQVFQRVLPDMFRGALDTFLEYDDESTGDNKLSVGITKYKQKPSPKIALYVKNELMKYEYMFYNWIKNRLHQQMMDLGITSHHSGPR